MKKIFSQYLSQITWVSSQVLYIAKNWLRRGQDNSNIIGKWVKGKREKLHQKPTTSFPGIAPPLFLNNNTPSQPTPNYVKFNQTLRKQNN